MKQSTTIAWILLSVRASPSTLQDIIAVADAINHAIPSHQELQTSLGWLRAQGLISKTEQQYTLTETGGLLLSDAQGRHRQIMKIWDLVADEIEKLPMSDIPLDDITQEETDSAYQAYQKDFWRRYEASNKEDSDA